MFANAQAHFFFIVAESSNLCQAGDKHIRDMFQNYNILVEKFS